MRAAKVRELDVRRDESILDAIFGVGMGGGGKNQDLWQHYGSSPD